jgi:2-keto-3-deoxy-galactonokinase
MSQAERAAVDWGTSSFRLWLIDRAGGVQAERRSQEGTQCKRGKWPAWVKVKLYRE